MVAEAATTGAAQAAPATSLRRVREVDMVCPLFRWGDVFAARRYLIPNKPRIACCGKKIGAAQKNTLNLSFNVNFTDYRSVDLCEPQVPSAHATPAEGLQVFGLVVTAFG